MNVRFDGKLQIPSEEALTLMATQAEIMKTGSGLSKFIQAIVD